MIKLTKAVIDTFNRKLSLDENKGTVLHSLYQLHLKLKSKTSPKTSYFIDDIDEFEEDAYGPGTMFIYWFENIMAETGNINLNFETQELSRRYWDLFHERNNSFL